MTVTERLDKHDKQIASIRDLVKEGIRMVVETRRLALETRKDLRELAAAQKRTDASLRPGLAFMTLHFPDDVATNLLTIDATDPKSGTAEFKATAIRIDRVARAAAVPAAPGA